MKFDSRLNFVDNANEIINHSISFISYHNNDQLNWLYSSQIKTFKWVLDQNDDNNLIKLKRIVLLKIRYLKKEKKKAVYRLDMIRLVQEINNLEFCLKAIIQDIDKRKENRKN